MTHPLSGMDLVIFDKDGRVIGVLTGVGERDDLEPLADLMIGSVEQLRID